LKTSDPPRRNTYSCTAPRLSWPPRLRFWRSPPHRLLRRHLVSSPAPTRWDRPAVNDPAMLRSTPHLAPCLGFLPPTINPRWRALGYSARFPKYGFDPEWQAFGYNPKYSGFQPRPSVLRAPQLPVSPDATDTGGSTTDAGQRATDRTDRAGRTTVRPAAVPVLGHHHERWRCEHLPEAGRCTNHRSPRASGADRRRSVSVLRAGNRPSQGMTTASRGTPGTWTTMSGERTCLAGGQSGLMGQQLPHGYCALSACANSVQ